MSNTTVFKSSGICSDASLPFLYRDPAIGPGTLFCFDMLDPYTWPSQAAPSGTPNLIDLSPVGANAIVAAGPIGWDGGLVFDGADNDLVNLPPSAKLAADVAGFAVSMHFKCLSVTGTGKGIAGIGDGYNFNTIQWHLHRDNGTVHGYVDGTSAGTGSVVVG